jgi:hypothetical protein
VSITRLRWKIRGIAIALSVFGGCICIGLSGYQFLIQRLERLVLFFNPLREHPNVGFSFLQLQVHDLGPKPVEMKGQVEDLLSQTILST